MGGAEQALWYSACYLSDACGRGLLLPLLFLLALLRLRRLRRLRLRLTPHLPR